MNALPLVSVVVPNYNYKRYLNLRIQGQRIFLVGKLSFKRIA